jgi:Lrp/AsnC family transcriptional regulator, leucine-responsive regulatory protein
MVWTQIYATDRRYLLCLSNILAVPSPDGALDRTDRIILDLLTEDARRTYGDIGARVGLSAPAVKRRVDRLEEAGVILGYTTRLDDAKLGRPLEAFTELRFSGRARVDTIAGIADNIPEVEAVFTVAGDPDALAWIRVADVHDLKRVIDRLRSTGKVTGTKTHIVLGTSRRSTP